jgi:hypothetical protein
MGLEDWANPLVFPHLQQYPMIPPNRVVSEVWHAQKWRNDMDQHCLSPMYDDGHKHFHIGKPAQMKNGSIIIPVWWSEDSEGKMWADAWQIEYNNMHKVDCNTLPLQSLTD